MLKASTLKQSCDVKDMVVIYPYDENGNLMKTLRLISSSPHAMPGQHRINLLQIKGIEERGSIRHGMRMGERYPSLPVSNVKSSHPG